MKRGQVEDGILGLLKGQAGVWGCYLRDERVDLLCRYAELLVTYDRANVIGSKELQSVLLDHALDSLSCCAVLAAEARGKLIDVGAGGGLPGIPLAIAQPELAVTLLEATEKKATFLRYVKEELQLKTLDVLNRRAEEAGADQSRRDMYDFAVTRAVASLPVILEYSAPFVRSGGLVLAMKGRLEEDELQSGRRAASRLGAELEDVVSVPFLAELEQKHRKIVVFRKTKPTPTGYPRRIGLAKKRPLGELG